MDDTSQCVAGEVGHPQPEPPPAPPEVVAAGAAEGGSPGAADAPISAGAIQR